MQLVHMQLPKEVTHGETVIRYFMVFSNARTFYQDERLVLDPAGGLPESHRTDWIELPTPPIVPPVVGLIDFGGMPLAMRADGSSYIFGKVVDEVSPERWVPFLEPVPEPERE